MAVCSGASSSDPPAPTYQANEACFLFYVCPYCEKLSITIVAGVFVLAKVHYACLEFNAFVSCCAEMFCNHTVVVIAIFFCFICDIPIIIVNLTI